VETSRERTRKQHGHRAWEGQPERVSWGVLQENLGRGTWRRGRSLTWDEYYATLGGLTQAYPSVMDSELGEQGHLVQDIAQLAQL
jgi:hypothetical protein